ncbi:MAG: TetR/AcrR family transcriptional regulator [Oscillospiraceae bacterium]|nr:TetR/AcrR family transcriptional regulator [Oscillospiraceae bacterium]
MHKQPDTTDATREALVTAFFQLAELKGIHQVTIREVTDLAGYNRTTFYRYFEDAYALVEYAEDDFFRSTQCALREQNRGEAIYGKSFFETFINCFRVNPTRIAVLMSEENRAHFIRRIKENVLEHAAAKIADTPRKKVVTDMFFFGVFSAIAIHIQSEANLSSEDLLGIIQKLFSDWYWPQIEEKA